MRAPCSVILSAVEDEELEPAPKKGVNPFIIGMFLIPWTLGTLFWLWEVVAWQAQSGWIQTEAKVVTAVVRHVNMTWTNECNRRNPEEVAIEYEYVVAGKKHRGNQYDYQYGGEHFCDIADAEARAKEVLSSGKVTAYYDPSDPSQAVQVVPDGTPLAIGGAVLLVVGAVLIPWFIRQRRRFRPPF